MKTKKIYVVTVWGKTHYDNNTVEIPYIFSELKYALKFIKQEKINIGVNWGAWTQKGAYLRNDKGQIFDDFLVI